MATTVHLPPGEIGAGQTGAGQTGAGRADRGPRGLDAWWLAAVVVVLGLGGGALTQYLQGVLDDPWAAWANSIAAWCLPAFVVGALAVRRGRAMSAGIVTLVLLLVGYYALRAGADGIELPPGTTLFVWTIGAVAGGVVFGLAGAGLLLAVWLARDARQRVVVPLLAGAIVPLGLGGIWLTDYLIYHL